MSFSSTPAMEGALAFVTLQHALRLFWLWLGYRVLTLLYNVSPLHPLYKFPGPKLAAASFLYEMWFDLVKGGKYSWEIKAMHQKYGTSIGLLPRKGLAGSLLVKSF